MLGEVTHLQSILVDLCNLTVDPSALPPASEQVKLQPPVEFTNTVSTDTGQDTDTITLFYFFFSSFEGYS